jgi:hypothetical protein
MDHQEETEEMEGMGWLVLKEIEVLKETEERWEWLVLVEFRALQENGEKRGYLEKSV